MGIPSRNKPKAIQEIEWFLVANKLKYKTEYLFDRLIDDEYRFNAKRMFKFDFLIPEFKIAIEYEGIFSGDRIGKKNSGASRHTNVIGYTNDTTKYNLAQIHGYKVLRYTAKNYAEFFKDIKFLLPNWKFL